MEVFILYNYFVKIILGALAHVDAGKTTLAEAILFNSSSINEMGRVDKADAFLDFNSLERQRGITIFNKEARFSYKNKDYIYFDTPGHTELAKEKERSLNVIDIALLIISATDSVTSDSIKTYNELMNLNIPTIIFVNKMDVEYVNKENILKDINDKLSINCLRPEDIKEAIALNDEQLLNTYLNEGTIDDKYIIESLSNNLYSPVIFGSALKNQGIKELLDFIDKYYKVEENDSPDFKAYVYKITNDNNEKLAHIKVLSGVLKNKDVVSVEKINEIRLYTGNKYECVNSVSAGELCALKGIKDVSIGTYLPSKDNNLNNANNNLTYELKCTSDPNEIIKKLELLNEEKPELNIRLIKNHLYINLEGELQKEIITEIIKDRFNEDISFSEPLIRYKETINKESYGVGHFEPLRHYAEVIVSIKPDEGLKFRSLVNNNFTGTLINYLEHHNPKGILTNSYLTNMCITIVDFKTHPKHTEGGDLINALKRAIRYALSKNKCKLLEPYYLMNISYSEVTLNLIIPELNNVKAIFTIEDNSLMCKVPQTRFNEFILNLKSKLKDTLSYEVIDTVYDDALNEQEIIDRYHYDYLSDTFNPAGSIFTSKGAGHYVDIDDVIEKMHLNLSDYFKEEVVTTIKHYRSKVSEEELKKVWNQVYKPKERYIPKNKKIDDEDAYKPVDLNIKPLMYVIDGYNLMYSIDDLKDLSASNFMSARDKVIDILLDFKGYVNADMIVVFDAYNNSYTKPQVTNDTGLSIVYTKHNQTADSYIEDITGKMSNEYKVITVTSDYLEQIRVLSNASLRLSSREFMMRYSNFKKNHLTKQDLPAHKPLAELKKLLEEE